MTTSTLRFLLVCLGLLLLASALFSLGGCGDCATITEPGGGCEAVFPA